MGWVHVTGVAGHLAGGDRHRNLGSVKCTELFY